MVDRAQIMKGLLEGCILKVIAQGETYGYQITNDMNASGFRDLNEGSVYPVLIRLEKKGYVESEIKKSDLGPQRKVYKITTSGEAYLMTFIDIWNELSGVVNRIMKGGVNHELSR